MSKNRPRGEQAHPTTADVRRECIAMRVRRASRVITGVYERALKPVGLTAAQFTLLVTIAEGAGRSISFLAETMGIERTTLTRNLRLLENAGLITMGKEGFRRQRSVELSEAGREALDSGLPLWQQAQQQVGEQLGEDLEPVLQILKSLARIG